MERYRFTIEATTTSDVTGIADRGYVHDYLARMLNGITGSGFSACIVFSQSDPVGTYGEHGMADCYGSVTHTTYGFDDMLGGVVVDSVRTTPVHQPEERPATCAC